MAGICSYRLCYFCGNGSRFYARYACYEIKSAGSDPKRIKEQTVSDPDKEVRWNHKKN